MSRIFDPQAARGRPRRLPDRTPRCGGVVVGREQPQPERVRVDRSFRFRALSVASRLHELEGWEPCGSRLAELQEALSGAGGISQGTWDRLQCWAGRWQALSEDVRVFYAATAGRFDAAGNALWHILQDGPPLPGAGLRAIRELYEDIHGGTPAAFDLDPRPWRGRDLPGGPR